MERKTYSSDPIELGIEAHSDESVGISRAPYNDAVTLARLGKTPMLERRFGFWAILAFSLLILCTWEGGFTILGVGLANGGPAGLIYQFIVVWIGNLATFTSLAELASMAPTAGGQYYWVSILAPASYQKLLSYVTGWLTLCGWQAGTAASSYIAGLFVQGFIEVVDTSYTGEKWQATLLMYAALLTATFATTVVGRYLPILEGIMLIIYIIAFFAVLVPIAWLGHHQSAKEVFTTFYNKGGWPSIGVSFMVGIAGNAFSFLGADAVYHMSEEVQNAATTVPKAMVYSLFINGVVGLASYIVILFSAHDIAASLNSGYSFPFISLILQILNSRAGTAIILAIMTVVDLGLLVCGVAAASRMLWSFARDRGVPFWPHVMKVHPKSTIPLNAIIITIIVSFLLGLISVGSPTAFDDALSLTIVALYPSYFMACFLLLIRRMSGSIKPFDGYSGADSWNDRSMNVPGSGGRLTWGPWRVPEPWGTFINAFACIYLSVVTVFCFFPTMTPVTPVTMNYACLILGFTMAASITYYFAYARREYEGPVIESRVRGWAGRIDTRE